MPDPQKSSFVEIRQAMPSDIKDWARMRHDLWPTTAASAHEAELREQAGSKLFVGFVALQDGKPIGFAEIFIRPFANGCDSRPVPFLEGIWVDAAHRRQGIARKLVNACEDWARGRGFREIGSDTEQSNGTSLKAHAGWGFRETERVVYFRKTLD
jgi:aminoglycoside 6'-N-acetyltransferase I